MPAVTPALHFVTYGKFEIRKEACDYQLPTIEHMRFVIYMRFIIYVAFQIWTTVNLICSFMSNNREQKTRNAKIYIDQ